MDPCSVTGAGDVDTTPSLLAKAMSRLVTLGTPPGEPTVSPAELLAQERARMPVVRRTASRRASARKPASSTSE